MKALVLPYPPGENHLYFVARGRKVLSAEGRAYKQRIAWLCLGQKVKRLAGAVVVSVRMYRPRKSGDIARGLKVTLDALSGYAYEDDGQICELHVIRLEDRENPRIEVRVLPWEAGSMVTVESP